MRKRVLNLIIFFVVAAAGLSVFCGFSGSVSFADAADSCEYAVISPDINKYLYLNNPALVAIRDDVVAVYDKDENKIFTAGGEHLVYTPTLSDGEKIINLAFANGTLYYLTNRSRLCDVKTQNNVNLGDKIVTDISSYEDVLYLYNSLINVWAYNGNDFTSFKDSEFKIIKSTAFAATDRYAYFVNEHKILTLDFVLDKTTEFPISENVTSLIAVGKDVYAVSDGRISKVDFENKTLVKTALPSVRNATSDGRFIATIPVGDNAIITYDSALNEKETYGSKSAKDKWFDSPEKVFSENGNVAVWDKANARVQFFFSDGTYKKLSVSKNATSIAVNTTHTAYTDGKKVYVVNNADFSLREINTDKNVGAISLTNDAVAIYDKNSKAIYTAGLSGNEFSLFAYSRAGVTEIKAIGGTNPTVYTLANGILSAVTKTTDFSVSVKNAISFDVDNTGNAVVLSKDDRGFVLKTVTRTAGALEVAKTATLHGDFEILSLFGVAIDLSTNGDVYLVDNVKNVLLKTTYSFDNKDTAYDKPCNPDEISSETVSYAYSKGTLVYSSINNFLDISDVVPAGDVVAILDAKDNMLFVMTQNKKFGYTLNSDAFLIRKEPSALSGRVVALFDNVSVYDYPGAKTGTPFVKSQILTLVDDCAGFGINGEFLKVSYEIDGKTKYGYVYKTSVMSYVAASQSAKKDVYAKAKAQRVGTTVDVYAMPDDTSRVLFDVPDGAKLKLLEDYNASAKFTLVEYNGQQGYILTSALKIDKGLTGGQIAAIVLASATVLITALYFVISRRNKKLSNKN